MITNDYMRTPKTHAAYMRKCGDSFMRCTAKRAVDMPVEADAIEAQLKAGGVTAKQRAYLRQRMTDLRERAPKVKQMGITFCETFYAGAARLELDTGQIDGLKQPANAADN